MYDNNSNKKKVLERLTNDQKESVLLVRDISVDFETQLYSINSQLKSQINLLNEKEDELAEKERTKIHNLDLFSPSYNNAYNNNDLEATIKEIKQKVEVLNIEQCKLKEKVGGLKLAIQCINSYIDITDTNVVEVENNRNIINDKGLSILEAQEIERQRIARDLHDSTVQNLTGLVHKSELCVKLIDIDVIRAKLELTTMSNTIKSVINEMRGIIYNLKPMTLDDLGLTITVDRYANRIMDLNNILVKVHSNEETKEILPVIKVTLFRIIQEACCNVVKHAEASHINIDIKYDEHNITVTIKDNGKGFNTNIMDIVSTEQLSSFGLSIMKERISLLSGVLDIQSEPGIGTIVTVSAPLTVYEGDKNE